MSAAFSLRAVAPEDGNPFERYPQLQTLWSPALVLLAREAIDEAFLDQSEGIDCGTVFLVVDPDKADEVWGLTGFLPWPDGAGVLQRVGLRWHGLVVEHRGQGLSMAVLEDVRARAHARYPMANHLVEFMPINAEHAATAEYFERVGFCRWGPPERVEWSDVLWQEYVCDIGVPLLLGPAASGPAPS